MTCDLLITIGSGRALSCGDGFQGQLGQGTMVMSRDVPDLVPLEQKILRVSCGESHTAVITNDRKLFLCGDGRHGKLCLDNLSNYFTFSSPKVFANVDVMKNQCKRLRIGFTSHVLENKSNLLTNQVACGGCHTIVLVKPKSGLPMVEDGEEVRGKSSPEKIDIVDIDEQQEFNTDSLARSRRRNKKQDKQTLLNRKELKVNLSFKSNRTIETNESPKKDEIRKTPENVNMAANDDDTIEDFDQKDRTTLEEDAENDDVSINELQHEYEAIKTEAGRNENSVTVVDGLNKNKTKKRSSRRTKAKLRSQPEAEDKPVDEADTNNNESEENKQSTHSKRRRNSKKHNKLRSRKNSAPKAPEMAAQSSEEIKKVEKKSRFCTIF